jgi:hypothetical protein
MPPSLKGGACRSDQTEPLAPETGKVQRSIETMVMDRATLLADPLPDPKTGSSLWAAEPKALATGLGCVALVHLRKSNPCLIAFVLKAVAQPGPA